MSHIYSYSQERFSSTEDPRDRVSDVRVGSGNVLSLKQPRIRDIFQADSDVTIPLTYLIVSRIKEWLRKE
jgi:hypothetical protein